MYSLALERTTTAVDAIKLMGSLAEELGYYTADWVSGAVHYLFICLLYLVVYVGVIGYYILLIYAYYNECIYILDRSISLSIYFIM